MSTICLDTIIQTNPTMISADMNGDTALMSIEDGKYFVLNPVSSRIWELAEASCSIRQICASLETEFDIDSARCETEVLEHLQTLLSENLIEVTHASAA